MENAGPGIGASDGRTHSLFVCPQCGSVCWASWTNREDVRIDAPRVRTGPAPEIPPSVATHLVEAIGAYNGNLPKAAVLMTRSAIQAVVREQEARGGNLAQEIDNLADRHIIPRPLADWAHEIRLAGNLVAHPDDEKWVVGADDAAEILGFADSLFEYLYVVPTRVQVRKQRATAALAETAEEPATQELVRAAKRLPPGRARQI